MREAIRVFLESASGRAASTIAVDGPPARAHLPIGGAAHVVAFVGHNGLMDFTLAAPPEAAPAAPPRSAIVLACASRSWFEPLLGRAGAHPLLLTTGLMAPEAYTLDAALTTWFGGGDETAVRRVAAVAYSRYQKCGLKAALRLFGAGG
jgi:hypothetical protein